MIEQEQNKQFGFEEIQRYLSGAMSPVERHELERAALQDPFLSDAIDGFEQQGTSNFVNHQHEITAAIQKSHIKGMVVDMPARNQWLRIVALFVLIAGVGLLGYQFFKPGNPEQVAVKEEVTREKPVVPEDKQTESVVVADSQAFNVESNKNLLPQKKHADVNQVSTANSADHLLNNKATESAIAVASTQADAADDNEFEPLVPGITGYISDSTKSLEPALSVEHAIEGKIAGVQVHANDNSGVVNSKIAKASVLQQGVVQDELGNPLPNAQIISADKKSTTLSDMFGRFSLVSKDTNSTVTVAAVGYSSKQVNLDKDAFSNTITLEPIASSLSEVVVTSMGISRKEKALGYQADKMLKTTQPVGGWESFHEYVRLQLGVDSVTYYEDYPGQEVTVEFNVDKEGKPFDVKILNEESAEKAAAIRRIIERGPRWANPEKRKKIRTTIPF